MLTATVNAQVNFTPNGVGQQNNCGLRLYNATASSVVPGSQVSGAVGIAQESGTFIVANNTVTIGPLIVSPTVPTLYKLQHSNAGSQSSGTVTAYVMTCAMTAVRIV